VTDNGYDTFSVIWLTTCATQVDVDRYIDCNLLWFFGKCKYF